MQFLRPNRDEVKSVSVTELGILYRQVQFKACSECLAALDETLELASGLVFSCSIFCKINHIYYHHYNHMKELKQSMSSIFFRICKRYGQYGHLDKMNIFIEGFVDL